MSAVEDGQPVDVDEDATGPEDTANEESTEQDVPETDDGTPAVGDGQQASPPSGLDDVDPTEIENAAGASDADGDDDTDGSSDDGAESYDGDTGEWGDMVVGICTTTTNTVIEKHGDGHRVDEDHFRSLNIDRYANQVMQKYADSAEMEPEKALVIGVALGVGGPVAMHTDLLSEWAEEVAA